MSSAKEVMARSKTKALATESCFFSKHFATRHIAIAGGFRPRLRHIASRHFATRSIFSTGEKGIEEMKKEPDLRSLDLS